VIYISCSYFQRLSAYTRNDGSSQNFDQLGCVTRLHRRRLLTSGTPSSSRYTVPWRHVLREHHHMASLGPAAGRSDSPSPIISQCLKHFEFSEQELIQTVYNWPFISSLFTSPGSIQKQSYRIKKVTVSTVSQDRKSVCHVFLFEVQAYLVSNVRTIPN
jgi:hypothetical protein